MANFFQLFSQLVLFFCSKKEKKSYNVIIVVCYDAILILGLRYGVPWTPLRVIGRKIIFPKIKIGLKDMQTIQKKCRLDEGSEKGSKEKVEPLERRESFVFRSSRRLANGLIRSANWLLEKLRLMLCPRRSF